MLDEEIVEAVAALDRKRLGALLFGGGKPANHPETNVWCAEALKWATSRNPNSDPCVVIIPSARDSHRFLDAGVNEACNSVEPLGVGFTVLHGFGQAPTDEMLKVLDRATMLYVLGGSPLHAMQMWNADNGRVLRHIIAALNRGAVLHGWSSPLNLMGERHQSDRLQYVEGRAEDDPFSYVLDDGYGIFDGWMVVPHADDSVKKWAHQNVPAELTRLEDAIRLASEHGVTLPILAVDNFAALRVEGTRVWVQIAEGHPDCFVRLCYPLGDGQYNVITLGHNDYFDLADARALAG